MRLKRFFDVISAFVGIVFLSPFLLLSCILASIATATNGLFIQQRIGQFGIPFSIYKLRTIHPKQQTISGLGMFLRNSKLDELPQLFNVLNGTMSFVGPRPDIAGYYDQLMGEDRKVLELKPGITSCASLKYRNEELLLASQKNPKIYNDTVIFPDKVRLNLDYYYKRSFFGDFQIILRTIVCVFTNHCKCDAVK